MEKEIICIDNSVSPEISKDFKEWIVKDKIYNIRKLQQNFDGTWGCLLEEIINPKFEVKLHGQSLGWAEPGFALWRFKYLNGEPLVATVKQEEFIKLN